MTSPHVPLVFERLSETEQLRRARSFFEHMSRRRSVRHFAPDPVPRALLEDLLRTAGTAPSGAHRQPWRFVAVDDPRIKKEIRIAAEVEEREFYERRASREWLADLEFLGLDWNKEFLETAPWIVAAFKVDFERAAGGRTHKNYYVSESVGLAVGLFLCAVHTAGLVALTHTPSPMKFLNRILARTSNERPFVLMPFGFPAAEARVHTVPRKALEEIVQWNLGRGSPEVG